MPKIWSQLLTVHAKLGDLFSIPVLFAFLPNKLKETYKKVFVEMKKMVPSLDDEQKFLKTFSCDFERGLMSAARTEFNVKIKCRVVSEKFLMMIVRKTTIVSRAARRYFLLYKCKSL